MNFDLNPLAKGFEACATHRNKAMQLQLQAFGKLQDFAIIHAHCKRRRMAAKYFGKPITELSEQELAQFEVMCDQKSAEKVALWPEDDEGIEKMLDEMPFWSKINADNLDVS